MTTDHTPPTDQTALRDRIAETLYRREWPNKQIWLQALAVDRETFLAQADAVLAVLPPPADRAAVLRWAADDLATAFGDPMVKHIGILGAKHLRRRAREIEAGQPGPSRMADETQPTQAHEPLHQWRVEILDGDEWMPSSGLRRDRSQAAHQMRMASEKRPLWNDGTPVHRRLVRETTTYTIEAEPAAGARQDGARS